MTFPITPQSILVRLKKEENPVVWNKSWEEFFDLYHQAVEITVTRVFRHHGWHQLHEEDVDTAVLQVFQSFNRAVQEGLEIDHSIGKLRQFLTTLCQRRVADFIRSHHRRVGTFDPIAPEHLAEAGAKIDMERFEAAENLAYLKAQMAELLNLLREGIPPRVFMIFELVKLNGEDPEDVAKELEIKRSVVDNSVYKAMKALRELHETLNSPH